MIVIFPNMAHQVKKRAKDKKEAGKEKVSCLLWGKQHWACPCSSMQEVLYGN